MSINYTARAVCPSLREVRRTRQEAANLARIVVNESREEEDTEDVEGARDERKIWEATHVTDEDFETNEGDVEDLYDKLMEMTGWNVTKSENENDLT
jgi:hypothetical protein